MKCKLFVLIVLPVLSVLYPAVSMSEDNVTLDQLGVQQQSYDTYDTRVNTYTKEVGKVGDNGVGVYGRTTNEYNNASSDRDTAADQKQGGGSISGGMYVDY